MNTRAFYLPALWKVGLRYLLRHRWQSLLMVFGIALGVAVVISIDLANASAGRAFALSTEALTGQATHQITGGPQGVPEQVYADLKRSGVGYAMAPVVSDYIASPDLGNRPLELLGLDPFSDGPFRSFISRGAVVPLDQLTAFLTKPGAVLISRSLAERYHLQAGATLRLESAGRAKTAFVAGLLDPADGLSQRVLEGVVLADISTAQELTDHIGWLSRIDLIVPPAQAASLAELEQSLPLGLRIAPATARSTTLEQLTEAFRINLSALSLLALMVGLFLIYNTMTFSVVQRRELFGMLRCLGVTRGEIFGLVTGEAAVVGLVGTLVGIGLGIVLGQGTVRMVSQTVNDLYFTTTVQAGTVAPESVAKGLLLGVFATVFTAAVPAWEAASVPPRAALMRSGLESKTRRNVLWAAAGGVGVLGVALLLFQIPTANLIVGFSGTVLTVLGAALLSAGAVVLLVTLLAPVLGGAFGLVGRLAPRNLLNSLSRTAVAVTALMVAVAVTIGVSIMIDSFRHTVVVWLDQTLQSDIYLSAPLLTATTPSAAIDPAVIDRLQRWPEVQRVDTLRSTVVQARQGQINLAATQNPQIGTERLFLALAGTPADVWPRLLAGDVLVSEPLADRLGLHQAGATLQLNTPAGWKDFRVLGIYYDYASSEGTVMMALPLYQSLWHDPAITALGLRLAPGQNVDRVVADLQDQLSQSQQLVIRANATLRRDVMVVFDRTFAITVALRLLATVVAFIGMLSALFLLQLEKQREVGILRALGLVGRQLRQMVLLETGLMGLSAGLLAIPTGYALALILVYVINRRSFGWTLQLWVQPSALLQGVLVALGAALLAGLYPAWRLSHIPAAEAIRYE
jgi:putative ABC transport system permease protein